MADVILELQDVQKYYPIVKGAFHQVVGHVKAVDGVSLTLNRGETLGERLRQDDAWQMHRWSARSDWRKDPLYAER